MAFTSDVWLVQDCLNGNLISHQIIQLLLLPVRFRIWVGVLETHSFCLPLVR